MSDQPQDVELGVVMVRRYLPADGGESLIETAWTDASGEPLDMFEAITLLEIAKDTILHNWEHDDEGDDQ